MLGEWSEWLPFPDPAKGEYLHAPFGPGVYRLRLKSDHNKLILVGCSKNVAYRMSSLLPRPYGCGKRNNDAKRAFVEQHLADIEYQTKAFATRPEAQDEEDDLRDNNDYEFPE